jgi:hypothetical protein
MPSATRLSTLLVADALFAVQSSLLSMMKSVFGVANCDATHFCIGSGRQQNDSTWKLPLLKVLFHNGWSW